MDDMNIAAAQYVAFDGTTSGIKATIDGQEMSVPVDGANRHYAEILRQVEAGALVVAAMLSIVTAVVLTLRDRGHLAQGLYLAVVATESVGILGVYGYIVTTAANPFLRQLAAAQWLILMTALILVTAIDLAIYRGARSYGGIRWGDVTARSQYALVSLCVIIIMTMGMMAYVRSGLRENWHIYGVMEDTSQWAYTPSIGVMVEMVGGITIVFLLAISFLFWIAGLAGRSSS